MALPSAGNPISLNQVNVELGLSGTTTISLNDAAVRTLFQKTGSGTEISMSDGYSKSATLAINYLVLAGGGAGCSGVAGAGLGGGGAGGYSNGSTTLSITTSYSVIIGAGGTFVASSPGNSGSNTSAFGITSVGGGGGNGGGADGLSGGSGGGAGARIFSTDFFLGGTSISLQGNDGGNARGNNTSSGGGGGGGAGGPGRLSNSTQTGLGGNSANWLDGVARAGGGGGVQINFTNTISVGGAGGGGSTAGSSSNASSATVNSGSGAGAGGGTGANERLGGNGGSGVVVIRYPGSTTRVSYTGTWTTSVTGGFVYHSLTGSGTLTVNSS